MYFNNLATVYSNSIDSSYLNVKQRIKQMNQNLTEDRNEEG